MPWNPNDFDSEILAIHAANFNYGKIIMLGGDQHDGEFNKAGKIDAVRLFDGQSLQTLDSRSDGTLIGFDRFDMFCSGHAMTVNGVLLVAGGTESFPDEKAPGIHSRHFPGLRDAAVFRLDDKGEYQYDRIARMNPGIYEGTEDIVDRPGTGGRWYPTLLTLGSGNILALSGHPGKHDNAPGSPDTKGERRETHSNYVPEVFTPTPAPNGGWHRLGDLRHLPDRDYFLRHATLENYPRAFVMPSGDVVFATPSVEFKTLSLSVDETNWKATYQDLCEFEPGKGSGSYTGYTETSVLLPLSWANGFETARILLAGGEIPWVLHTRPGEKTEWRQTGPRALAGSPRRMNGIAVLLPTGQVLMVGGVAGVPPKGDPDDDSAVRTLEVFDPPADQDSAESDTIGTWSALESKAELERQPRNYHSVALLMADGRVWVAGGDEDAKPGIEWANRNIEVYEPKYYGDPNRPEITAAPDRWFTGSKFRIASTQAKDDNIEHVVMIRMGSVTHAFNPDQRCLFLRFERRGGDELEVDAPPTPNVAPPGMYFLFTINKQQLPSHGVTIYLNNSPETEAEVNWDNVFSRG